MLPSLVPKSITKLQKKILKEELPLPPNEIARLLVLKQCKILNTHRNDIEYDRFVALAKRIFEVPAAYISLIDSDHQWIKSCIGVTITNPFIPRHDSLDATLMFPDTPEIVFISDLAQDDVYKDLASTLGVEEEEEGEGMVFRFYMGAVITVDGLRVGVLSIVDTIPREHVTLESRQNLLDLAIAVSNMLQERRLRNLQLSKQRANLLLGLNHNLGAPVLY
eukprot:gene4532-4970_t